MSQLNYALSPGSWVLVSGANGFIASHIVDILLERGYNVRGTVRAEKPWLNRFFETKYGERRFETVIVSAIEHDGAFDEAAKGVSGFIHVASDVSLSPDPNAVIPKAVAGTLNALRAASKQSLKRFVLTSSSAAALLATQNERGIIVDKNTWNDAAVAAAWSDKSPPQLLPAFVYAASKTEAERQAWQWVTENKPSFVFNTVLPNVNFGQILIPEIPGSSTKAVRNLLTGDASRLRWFPPQYFIDVRDNARLHIAALLDPAVESERVFALAAPFNWTDIIGILRQLRPENRQIPDPPENEGRDLSEIVPRKRAEKLLQTIFGRPGWTSLQESIATGIEDLE